MTVTDAEARDLLFQACDNKDLAKAQQLFAASNLAASDASEALRHISKKNLDTRAPICRLLLEHGADANVVPSITTTSLEVVKLLTEFGFDIKSEGHKILENYSKDREAVDWLLDQGVDINKTNTARQANGRPGYSEMFDWSNHLLNNVAANGDIEFFDDLVSRGADPHRSLALHDVSRCRDDGKATAMVHHLLDAHNMNIHADNEDLRHFFHDAPDSGTPLCSAIDNQNLAVVKALLDRGAKVDKWGARGHIPVSIAAGTCMNGKRFEPAVRPLLQAGTDPDMALECVIGAGMLDAAEACLEHGADPIIGFKLAREQDSADPDDLLYWNDADSDDERDDEQVERDIGRRMQEMVKLMEKRCEKLKDTPADPDI